MSSINRKFERMFNLPSNVSEVRPDSVGALSSEVQHSEGVRKDYLDGNNLESDLEEKSIKLGHFEYDFENNTERFVRYGKGRRIKIQIIPNYTYRKKQS